MSEDPVLLDWMEDQIQKLNIVDSTLKHYRTLLARLHEYGEIRKWRDATTENLARFDVWLADGSGSLS